MQNGHIYSLRIAVRDDEYLLKRAAELVSTCKKYAIDDVMFYVNYCGFEDYYVHKTVEDMRRYAEALKRIKPMFDAEGISVSLNPMTTIGQGEFAGGLRGKHAFTTLTGPTGIQSNATACPLNEEFNEYITSVYSFLTREIKPRIIWIEDDFRMHNRVHLNWGGCFCDLHMKKYCEALGKTVTRDEFVEKLLEPDAVNREYRFAYASVTRKAMESLAKNIADAVHAACPETRIGFMTSHPEEHAVEYRDWDGLFDAADERGVYDRIHLPHYEQCSPQEYLWDFTKISVQTRARISPKTAVLPELEASPDSPYMKSVNFARMQLETAQVLGTEGITLALYEGNGIVKKWGYHEMLAAEKPYLQAVQDLNLDFNSLDGVTVPFSDESVLHMKPTDYCDFLDHIKPDDSWFSALFASIGVAFKLEKDPIRAVNKVVAVSGQWLRNFARDEAISFIKNNFLLLNADAVETIVDLGLGEYIGVKAVESNGADKPEEYAVADIAEADFDVCGIKRYTERLINGNIAVKVRYADESKIKRVYSRLCGNVGAVAPGCVLTENAFIYPFRGERRNFVHFKPLHEAAIKAALEQNPFGNRAFMTSSPCLSPYYFAGNNVLMLLNFLDDDAPLRFTLPCGFCLKTLTVIDRDGTRRRLQYRLNGNNVETDEKAKAMSSTVILINQ